MVHIMTFRMPDPPSTQAGGSAPAGGNTAATHNMTVTGAASNRNGTVSSSTARSSTARGSTARGSAARSGRETADSYLLGEIDRLIAGHHHDPHAVLGVHADAR